MKLLVYVALLSFTVGFTNQSYGQINTDSDRSSEEEEVDEVKEESFLEESQQIEEFNTSKVEDLLDYNFYSKEVQSFLKSKGIDASYFGDKSSLSISTEPGVEIKFNSSRNLNYVKYERPQSANLPYGLTPNMKFRKAKKKFGKEVRKPDRRTLWVMDDYLEVTIKYPPKGKRNRIEQLEFYSIRESHPCTYCDAMHAKAEEKKWNDETAMHQASMREREEIQRIEQEAARQEALEEAERKAKEKEAYEKKEREWLEEYRRQEEKRKEAAKEANPFCSELQSIFDEGPEFNSIQGVQIKEDNSEFELVSEFKATKTISGFQECAIRNVTNLYFFEAWISYDATSSFSELDDAKALYRNVTQQILMCPNYQRSEAVSGSTALEGNIYFVQSENRYGAMMKVHVFIVKNQESQYVVHLKIQDE